MIFEIFNILKFMKQFSEDVDIFKISKSWIQNLKNFKMLKISKIMFLVFLDGFDKFLKKFFFQIVLFSIDFYRYNFVTTPLPAAPQLHRAVSSILQLELLNRSIVMIFFLKIRDAFITHILVNRVIGGNVTNS